MKIEDQKDKPTLKFFDMPNYVGSYIIGGYTYKTMFRFDKKPNWFNRLFCRLLLGWKWKDFNRN